MNWHDLKWERGGNLTPGNYFFWCPEMKEPEVAHGSIGGSRRAWYARIPLPTAPVHLLKNEQREKNRKRILDALGPGHIFTDGGAIAYVGQVVWLGGCDDTLVVLNRTYTAKDFETFAWWLREGCKTEEGGDE